MQGCTYLIMCRFFHWLLLHTLQNSQGGRIAAEHGVVRAKGSWVTLATLPQKIRLLPPPSPTTTTQKLMLVCLLGKFACTDELHKLSDLFHCLSLKAIGMASYETALLFQCGTACLYMTPICTARKIHQNKQPL